MFEPVPDKLRAICSFFGIGQTSAGKVLEMIARAPIKNDTCIYMDYGSEEMLSHVATPETLMSAAHMLMTKRVNLTSRVVPGGNHSEASWEKQIPIFMECLGL